jgi:peptidyl-prolyl cis-trans isomerase SurA
VLRFLSARPGLRTVSAIALLLAAGTGARAATVERVVAVIGDHAILLSDMRQRARPFLMQIHAQFPSGAQQAAAESEMYKQLIDRMVDEKLEQQAAEKAHITVTTEEIDAGLRNVASQQGLTVDQLTQEAQKTGLTAQEYRDEVRRQLLEGKLLQLRVRGRVRVSEDDIKATYAKLVRTDRKRLSYRIAWVVLHVPADSSQAARADRQDLGDRIAATARAGADLQGRRVEFASLAASFSDDANTRQAGGDMGTRKPGELAQPIEDEAMKLEVGGVSPPFRYKDAIVVIKLLERESSQLPALAQAHDELMQRSYAEQMDKARKEWLEELKHGMYVDVRL